MSIETGSTAPTFSLDDAVEGQSFDLDSAVKAGPALVGIYKSSCEASKKMFTMLERLRQAYPEDAITIWGVSQDSPNVTRSFRRRIGITFPILVDAEGYPVSAAYDIEATPTVYLVDRNGTIVWQLMGFQKPAIQELSEEIAKLVGVEPVDVVSDTDDIPNWVPG
jgi:peroxiredoxin